MSRVDRWPRSALVLDDEAYRRETMRSGLLEHGVECDGVATLAEAIRRLTTSSYDLVVCDIVMCDPPGAANPSLRGYLAVCFALARSDARWVVQASSVRRWAHPGALLTNWRVDEVANLIYGDPGIPIDPRSDGGCPWCELERCAAACPARRAEAARGLSDLPIVRALESSAGLDEALGGLEEAAGGRRDWGAAVSAVGETLFPGAAGAR